MLAMKGDRHVHVCSLRGCWAPVWATFSSQISFTSDSGSKDKMGWNSREINGWSWGLRFCDRFLVIFCWSLWESSRSRNTQKPLLQIFTEPSCYPLGIVMILILGSGKLKAGIPPPQKCTKAQETEEQYTSPASCKQNPSLMGLIWRQRPLTEASPGEYQSQCRKHALMRPLSKRLLSSLDIFVICNLRCYRNYFQLLIMNSCHFSYIHGMSLHIILEQGAFRHWAQLLPQRLEFGILR